MIGQTLAHYRIEAKLGEGGMGVVYTVSNLSANAASSRKPSPPPR